MVIDEDIYLEHFDDEMLLVQEVEEFLRTLWRQRNAVGYSK